MKNKPILIICILLAAVTKRPFSLIAPLFLIPLLTGKRWTIWIPVIAFIVGVAGYYLWFSNGSDKESLSRYLMPVTLGLIYLVGKHD